MFPKDSTHWHADPSGVDGFRNVCKGCRNKELKLEEKREKNTLIQQRMEEFDDEVLAYWESMPKMADGNESLPHITSYYERMNQYLGGPDGVSRHMMMVYLSGSPAIRARILIKFWEMSEKISEAGYSMPPVEMLSTEDLERELEKRIKEINPEISQKNQTDEAEITKALKRRVAQIEAAELAEPHDTGEADGT